jgi:hypothetical protein
MYKAKPWKKQQTKYAHLKLDGHRVGIYKDLATGQWVVTTRDGHNIADKLQSCDFMRVIQNNVAHLAMFEAELFVLGGDSGATSTAIAHDPELLRLGIFAISSMSEDTSLPVLEDTCRRWDLSFIPWSHWFNFDHERMVPHILNNRPDLLSNWCNRIEGWIFKDANYINWYKFKHEQTIDLVVTGVKDGTGKYEGLIGALKCSVNRDGQMLEVANVSGMKDDDRYIPDNEVIGKVIEVRFQNVGAEGRLRHPRFKRWRPDKQAAECTIDQCVELSNHYELFP